MQEMVLKAAIFFFVIMSILSIQQNKSAFLAELEEEFDQLYEAREAFLVNAVIDSQHQGYTRTGFEDYNPNAPGRTITWTVPNVPAEGEYTVEFQYVNASKENRPSEIKVNDAIAVCELALRLTGEWSSWKTIAVKVNRKAGENVIVAAGKGLSREANIDQLHLHNHENEEEGSGPGASLSRLQQAKHYTVENVLKGWKPEQY